MPPVDSSFVPFKNAWERIARARAHRYALGEAWNSLSHEDLTEFWFYVNDDGTGSMRSIPIDGALPSEFSLLLGETLYHLRAALDNVIYDAAILDSGQNPPPNAKDLEFLVCTKKARFDELAFKPGPLSGSRKAVVKAVQPYNAPKLAPDFMVYDYNRALGILSNWARKDRHRKLNVFAFVGC